MKRLLMIAALTLGGLTCWPLAAEELCKKSQDQIECMTDFVEIFLPTCQYLAHSEFDLAAVSPGATPTKYRDCTNQGRSYVQAYYANAKPAARKRKAEAELKEYSAMALAAFAGIEPGPDEPKIAYRIRQSNTLQALRAQAERVKLK